MTIAELNTLYASAAADIADGDWSGAKKTLLKMQARLASTPNVTRTTGDGGSQSITWNPASIEKMLATCDKMLAADAAADSTTGPWQQSKITWKRPTT